MLDIVSPGFTVLSDEILRTELNLGISVSNRQLGFIWRPASGDLTLKMKTRKASKLELLSEEKKHHGIVGRVICHRRGKESQMVAIAKKIIVPGTDENNAPKLNDKHVVHLEYRSKLRSSDRSLRALQPLRNCPCECDQIVASRRSAVNETNQETKLPVVLREDVGIVEKVEAEDPTGHVNNMLRWDSSIFLTPVENSLNQDARRSLRLKNKVKLTAKTFRPDTVVNPETPVQTHIHVPVLKDEQKLLALPAPPVKTDRKMPLLVPVETRTIRENLAGLARSQRYLEGKKLPPALLPAPRVRESPEKPIEDVCKVTKYIPAKIFICDKCLKHYKRIQSMQKHECTVPEGLFDVLIYEKGSIRVYQVDGAKYQAYGYNVTKLAQVYLDVLSGWKHATLFHFFALYVNNRFVGFFSKQKDWNVNNLGAIMVLPAAQRKGYGKFLIALSYEISKRENVISTPERPFTPAGYRCYLSYWCEVLRNYLSNTRSDVESISDISKATLLHPKDILTAFQSLGPGNILENGKCILNIFKDVVSIYTSDQKECLFDGRSLLWTPRLLISES